MLNSFLKGTGKGGGSYQADHTWVHSCRLTHTISNMPLLAINDLETLKAKAANEPQGLLLVELPGTGFDCSFLKFGLHGCCEVLGYQLAPRLRVPVMPAVAVWSPHATGHGGQAAGEGRIGLAVQYSEAFEHVTWEQAASQAPEAAAASLVLCLLARDEWGQFAATKLRLVFYDLKRLFPGFCPERMDGQSWEDVARELSHAAGDYRGNASSFMRVILGEAERLGLMESLRVAVADAATISEVELMNLFDLEPHPLAAQIGRIAADVPTMQFKHAARLLCG